MTLTEVSRWIDETPAQHHAIGRHQIIPNTLNYLRVAEGIPMTAMYSPALQDQVATGQSAYHGQAGNRATIPREEFRVAMVAIIQM
ncbi:MAG TPA: hypothetical protein ENK63_03705 [Rhodobacterales bacterium]|nr:hypothetical protein [Rhodobacterales bacterium]